MMQDMAISVRLGMSADEKTWNDFMGTGKKSSPADDAKKKLASSMGIDPDRKKKHRRR